MKKKKLKKDRNNWKKYAEAQTETIENLCREIDRLQAFLRSLPQSLGITEKDILPDVEAHKIKAEDTPA